MNYFETYLIDGEPHHPRNYTQPHKPGFTDVADLYFLALRSNIRLRLVMTSH